MGILPWGRKKEDEIASELNLEKAKPSTALVRTDESEESTAIVPVKQRQTAIAPVKRSSDIVISRGGSGAIVQVRSKEIMIAGKKRKTDPYQLIRLIKRVTQSIGEYKACGTIYADVIVNSLRKGRSEFVDILEEEFGIHWQINQDTGESTFYM